VESVRELRLSEETVTGPDEVVRAKLDAESLEAARDLIHQTLVGDGYRLSPTDKTDVWTLCRERGRTGKRLDHIATVSLTATRRQEKKAFTMSLRVPQEHLIGSADDRHRQAKSWISNVAGVAAERSQILRQQSPYHVVAVGMTLAS
jgi:hypothetical protein